MDTSENWSGTRGTAHGGSRGRGRGNHMEQSSRGPVWGNGIDGEYEETQPADNRKRRWDESKSDVTDDRAKESIARKKKRGGKKAKEKELKWKIAQGMVDPNDAGATRADGHADSDRPDSSTKQAVNGEHEHNEHGAQSSALVKDEEDMNAVSEPAPIGEQASQKSLPNPNKAKLKPSKTAGLPAWIANPLTISDQIAESAASDVSSPSWGLSARLTTRLREKGITHLFPVQMAVLPRLLQTRYSSASIPPGDLCVSAPTGSGKTLAYALPIVEALIDRVVPRVRALVVLPTRDLAAQVKLTFDMLLRGTDIRVLLVTGQTPFATEQSQLVSYDECELPTEELGSSRVDVLIATPGRLIDHLNGTKGFTLRHLRFLVIDEADRLLNQSYQDWLSQVLQAAEPTAGGSVGHGADKAVGTELDNNWARLGFAVNSLGLPTHKAVSRRHALTSSASTGHTSTAHFIHHYTPLQKLLFSATLTRNPAKIASLHLYNPSYIAVVASDSLNTAVSSANDEARYVAPSTLEERMIVCASLGQKPLMLLHLLYNLESKGALVFTKSVEAAHRLAALIQIFDRSRKAADDSSDESSDDSDNDSNAGHAKKAAPPKSAAQAFSSDLPPVARRRLLASFKAGQTSALICSDVMARGMDLGVSVQHVINYDIPTRIKTYVHRIGRTARAGRSGIAWSILEDKEVRWFKTEVGKIERVGTVARIKAASADTALLMSGYQDALKELGGLMKKHPGGPAGDSSEGKSNEDAEAVVKKRPTSDSDDDESATDSEDDSSSPGSACSDSSSTSSDGQSSSESEGGDGENAPSDNAPAANDGGSQMNADTNRLEAALKYAASLISEPTPASGVQWWE